jgi:hypothetical protein
MFKLASSRIECAFQRMEVFVNVFPFLIFLQKTDDILGVGISQKRHSMSVLVS